MQDPSAAFEVIINSNKSPQFPEQEQHLKCPRCESTNTKFCYYNNYNLSQPRHFCKNCRRYWTKGGALRNIPVGGGTRKNSKRTTATSSSSTSTPTPSSNNKRSSAASSSSTASTSLRQVPKIEPISAFYATTTDSDHQMLDINGSFSSLLASSGNFGNLLDGFHSVGPMGLLPSPDDLNRSMCSSALELQSSSNGDEIADPPPPLEDFLGLQGDSGCCIGTNGWPDLAIYTPGSTFQ